MWNILNYVLSKKFADYSTPFTYSESFEQTDGKEQAQVDRKRDENTLPRFSRQGALYHRSFYSPLDLPQEIKLGHIQIIVSPFLSQQLFVSSFFQNSALVHIHNAVGVFNGGQSVGDDEGGSSF